MRGSGNPYLDVPPDVTTGRVVVVVGGRVVGGGRVVVVVGVVVGTEAGVGALEPADDPGCSRATVTPMKALAPPATTIVVLVSRLTRACARVRALGEYRSCVCLTASRGDGAPASAPGQSRDPRLAEHTGPT